MTAAAGALPRFSDRVLKFMERVEHRVATTDCERKEVFRLRYEAYARNALMAPEPDRRLFDRYDNSENAWITMTFVDGELAGSLRVNVGVGVDADLPSLRVYPDVVRPRLKAGQIVVEYTRLAAKLSVSIAHPGVGLCHHATGIYGGRVFRRRPRHRHPSPGAHAILQARVRRRAMVRATRISWSHCQVRMYGSRISPRPKKCRGALSLLQIRANRAGSAFRAE